MPTVAGIPVAELPEPMLYAGPLNPPDWASLDPGDPGAGIAQEALMRGQPVFAAAWQRKQIPGPATVAMPGPIYIHSRPYSRGAQAFSPKFGVLNINPIGAGVVAPYKLPVIAGPGARYQFGAIFFDVQTIGTSLKLGPTIPTEALDQLLATSSVAAMYQTTG